MLMLSWIFKLNNYISEKIYRPPPLFEMPPLFTTFQRRFYYGRLFKTIPGDALPAWSY